jgi:glutamate N-acetyltransferase/amino-acid N-acetyltransferase
MPPPAAEDRPADSWRLVIKGDLGAGTESATIWTNDLSVAYVHENSAYST